MSIRIGGLVQRTLRLSRQHLIADRQRRIQLDMAFCQKDMAFCQKDMTTYERACDDFRPIELPCNASAA
jgi:hypothetical protein